MVRLTLAALTSAALLPALSAGASAQSYAGHGQYGSQHSQSYEQCIRQQRNRQVTGAVIGGLLGAVVGAELHDDQQDRARDDRRYRDRHYRGHRGHRRHRGRHYRGHHEEGNDGAVLAGAGLGALAGAAVAGNGNACDHLRHQGYGYSQQGYSQGNYGYADQGGYYVNENNGGGDGYYYEGPAQYSYDTEGYGSSSSSQVLVGGEDYRLDSRSYSASSVTASYSSTGNCRDMRSGNGAITLMCQGTDGIWRPAR